MNDLFKIICAVVLAIIGIFIVSVTVSTIIDVYTIKKKAKEKYVEAAKILIKDVTPKTVTVGLYDTDDKKLKTMEIESEKGVDESIVKGMVLYC